VAAPGLIGGLAVAVVWLAVSGFTFTHFLNKTSPHPWVLFAVPIAVGVGGTLWAVAAPPPDGAPRGWPPSPPAWPSTCTASSRSR